MREKIKKISSPSHSLVKHLALCRKDSGYREEMKSVLIMGSVLFDELPKTAKIKEVLSTEDAVREETTCIVTSEIIQKITGLSSTEGFLAEVELPAQSPLPKTGKLLVLDGISDPGNVGTLLRSALAFGFSSCFLLPNTADLFNDKVLRASRAAPFHLPFKKGSFEELQKELQESARELFIADTEGTLFTEIGEKKSFALLLGNEARGPSQEVLAFGQQITIPMEGTMESLNVAVAAGILMYFLGRHG